MTAYNFVEAKALGVVFHRGVERVRALNEVSLRIKKNQTVGLVGESGCGKSVTARALMGLLEKNACATGELYLGEEALHLMREKDWQRIRGKKIALIVQDPHMALNPVFTIGHQLSAVIQQHGHVSKKQAKENARQLLEAVGFHDANATLASYPHTLSGGMRQRVLIAMACSCKPDFLIADEPTTDLDMVVQAQILGILKKMQMDMGMGMLLISHDFGIMAQMASDVAVMHAGRIVECGETKEILSNPQHPYTKELLCCDGNEVSRWMDMTWESKTNNDKHQQIKGCYYIDRCPHPMTICSKKTPDRLGSLTRYVRCWKYSSHASL